MYFYIVISSYFYLYITSMGAYLFFFFVLAMYFMICQLHMIALSLSSIRVIKGFSRCCYYTPLTGTATGTGFGTLTGTCLIFSINTGTFTANKQKVKCNTPIRIGKYMQNTFFLLYRTNLLHEGYIFCRRRR